MRVEVRQNERDCRKCNKIQCSYLDFFNFTELHLDSVIKYHPTTSHHQFYPDSSPCRRRCRRNRGRESIPDSLFKHCPNVAVLSLRHNFLEELSPQVGRLDKLRKLYLTNNRWGFIFFVLFG